MPHYIASVKYEGTARIAIETKDELKDLKSFSPFRSELQSHAVDMGVPQFKTAPQDVEIEKMDEGKKVQMEIFKETKRLMSNNEKRWNSIFTKKALADVIRNTAKELNNAESE